MHNVRKGQQEVVSDAQKAATLVKITKFRAQCDASLADRHANRLDREALGRATAVFEQCPENYTLCGYRRDILLHVWASETAARAQEAGSDPEAQAAAAKASAIAVQAELDTELEHSAKVLAADYKCYQAFLHRRWLLGCVAPPLRRLSLLAVERKRCDGLLKKDERNFHAWGYRRYVDAEIRALLPTVAEEPAALVDGSPEAAAVAAAAALCSDVSELRFTEAKLNDNFSNYSAWHNRALVVAAKRDAAASQATQAALDALVASECALATRALCCDPGDQSAWLFCRFLVEPAPGGAGASEAVRVAQRAAVLDVCRQLLEEAAADATKTAPGAASLVKWPLWALAVLGDGDAEAWRRLAAEDPAREGYYLERAAAAAARPSA